MLLKYVHSVLVFELLCYWLCLFLVYLHKIYKILCQICCTRYCSRSVLLCSFMKSRSTWYVVVALWKSIIDKMVFATCQHQLYSAGLIACNFVSFRNSFKVFRLFIFTCININDRGQRLKTHSVYLYLYLYLVLFTTPIIIELYSYSYLYFDLWYLQVATQVFEASLISQHLEHLYLTLDNTRWSQSPFKERSRVK